MVLSTSRVSWYPHVTRRNTQGPAVVNVDRFRGIGGCRALVSYCKPGEQHERHSDIIQLDGERSSASRIPPLVGLAISDASATTCIFDNNPPELWSSTVILGTEIINLASDHARIKLVMLTLDRTFPGIPRFPRVRLTIHKDSVAARSTDQHNEHLSFMILQSSLSDERRPMILPIQESSEVSTPDANCPFATSPLK
ncbi:hypothetical protein P175DRAFT_0555260 [Aspergillus ochraceoroseus IBT 24754]|uniref:Uncharacterized protein n=1 Tax=Aspergillus ochraceoroseus IBT 24754 TaxID=1392256 RepID=A0A2T5M245_9EURO|nr:uncharacterized protein P175DRAFT_0555260 [Aspergillus ochraceoroseus IBT 24754]PTU22596.1 hypothetical protein P175DRAFT_0555260 [Aspergillus ochraceoroseus IBT 24754]